MKKTLTIVALALVLLLCCVSCGGKEVTVTLNVDAWNNVAKAKGFAELKLTGSNTLTCKKGDALNIPKVLKNGAEVQVNWTTQTFTDNNVASNAMTVITGAATQVYRPTESVVLYAYDF